MKKLFVSALAGLCVIFGIEANDRDGKMPDWIELVEGSVNTSDPFLSRYNKDTGVAELYANPNYDGGTYYL